MQTRQTIGVITWMFTPDTVTGEMKTVKIMEKWEISVSFTLIERQSWNVHHNWEPKKLQ